MFGSRRLRRSEVARARLRALSPAWVPTPEIVANAFGAGTADGPSDLPDFETLTSEPVPIAPFSAYPVTQDQQPGDQWGEMVNRSRFGIDRSAASGVLLLALGAVVGAAVVLVLGWPRGEAAPTASVPPVISTDSSAPGGATALPTAMSSASTAATSASSGVVVIDVAGLVRKPGVVELPAGSRVIDALEAAGGVAARGNTTGLNLAQILVDGEQVLVLSSAQQSGAAVAGGPAAPAAPSSSLVNVNTATLEQLDTLPGIGPVLAQAIIDWRTQNGGFSSIDQLQEVSGIGDATYADLQPLVRV